MLSVELEIAIQVAASEAQVRKHEFFGLEHMLYALLHDKQTAHVIKRCGGDPRALLEEVETWLKEEVPTFNEKLEVSAQPTLGLQRTIQRAAMHVRGAGKDKVHGANVLVAMFTEEESWAIYILEQHGVSRLDVVSYLSHGSDEDDARPS